ncbi:MAG: hypothetical protein ACYSUI_17855, partial [Planctomycetota bacterium]
MSKRAAALCIVGLLLHVTVDAAGATRLRLVFPGFEQGQEMPVAELRLWYGWLAERDYDIAGFHRQESTVEVIL